MLQNRCQQSVYLLYFSVETLYLCNWKMKIKKNKYLFDQSDFQKDGCLEYLTVLKINQY